MASSAWAHTDRLNWNLTPDIVIAPGVPFLLGCVAQERSHPHNSRRNCDVGSGQPSLYSVSLSLSALCLGVGISVSSLYIGLCPWCLLTSKLLKPH